MSFHLSITPGSTKCVSKVLEMFKTLNKIIITLSGIHTPRPGVFGLEGIFFEILS